MLMMVLVYHGQYPVTERIHFKVDETARRIWLNRCSCHSAPRQLAIFQIHGVEVMNPCLANDGKSKKRGVLPILESTVFKGKVRYLLAKLS